MKFTYLALGDSYTIGEGVLPDNNFPSQTVKLLNQKAVKVNGFSIEFSSPTIIAKTGWTTDELDADIDHSKITAQYDIVSLLIGVNNQYRGRSVSDYKVQLDHLLQRAIGFAKGKTNHVFVLSIPDWGVTPFAEGRNRDEVASGIDAYNTAAKNSCEQYRIVFIDITSSQREDGTKEEFLVADGLHPSGKEYAKWAEKLEKAIKSSW